MVDKKTIKGKVIWFDIDGVIFKDKDTTDYSNVEPLQDNIVIINRVKLLGNTVILFTARGSKTGIDWRGVTDKQLEEHGVLHDVLLFGKPACDYCVDDKMITMDKLRAMVSGQS